MECLITIECILDIWLRAVDDTKSYDVKLAQSDLDGHFADTSTSKDQKKEPATKTLF